MLIRAHLAITLDGAVCAPEGYPAVGLMPGYRPGESHGSREFMAQCDAVVMGRNTFVPALTNAWWPWPDKHVHVLTSRPLPQEPPERVTVCRGGLDELLRQLREADYQRDVQVLAGPRLIRELLDRNAIDRLELQILPILSGGGIPLFEPGRTLGPLDLDRVERFPDGTVGVEYILRSEELSNR